MQGVCPVPSACLRQQQQWLVMPYNVLCTQSDRACVCQHDKQHHRGQHSVTISVYQAVAVFEAGCGLGCIKAPSYRPHSCRCSVVCSRIQVIIVCICQPQCSVMRFCGASRALAESGRGVKGASFTSDVVMHQMWWCWWEGGRGKGAQGLHRSPGTH